MDKNAVLAALAKVNDPELGRPITELGWVKDIAMEGDVATITLALPENQSADRRATVGSAIRAALPHATVRWDEKVAPRVGGKAPADDPLPGVRHVILVMSGKGGVGKSSCAVNLTMALHRAGYRVGLLDADIYGPSIPTMMGVSGRPVSMDGKSIEPLERFGVKLMSIGFLLEDAKSAVIWRGPMLHGALQQFLKDVNWGELDFLVLDLPPGTGDIALTLSQRVRITGAVVITTPQPVATDDVFKSVSMCKKVDIPVLGIVENMSYFIDTAGVRHELFGKGGGQAVADFAEAPLLGQVPIDQTVREWADKGTPVVQAAPGSPIARTFVEIAERLVDKVLSSDVDRDEAPVIDRSGGTGGKKRLPVMR